ncbi:MAG: SDR family NAD(P)-dependent oxidoreductase [Actinomycetota bacterium]
MDALSHKVALVTGAGTPSGIGWATAQALANAGALVVVTDVEHEPGPTADVGIDALAAAIRGQGGDAMAVPLDITDRAQIDRCVAMVSEHHGGVDVVVNNAGTSAGARPFLEITAAEWDASYRVNLKGTADVCQAVIPTMTERGGGSIVNVASTGGLGAEAGFGAYTATKHGVVGLTKTIAAEFGRAGIRCNAVCPGFVATRMHTEATERLAAAAAIPVDEMAARRYEAVAQGRASTPDEIAAVIAFLAGPAASYITGAAIPVSGGTPVGL